MTFFDDTCASVDAGLATADALAGEKSGGGFWRKEPPDVDGGQLLTGGMWPSQRKWWEQENFIRLLVGGYGAGKTVTGAKWSIAMALTNAPCPHAYVAPTFPIARKTGIPTLAELLQGKKSILGRAFDWDYHKTLHEFTIKYHGRMGIIHVYSGENPLSLRGPNLGSAWIDEPFIQVAEVLNQMMARVRHPQAVLRAIGLTGTPEELNWGYDIVEGEDAGNYDVGVVKMSTRENKVLNDDYVTRLEGALSERAAAAYIDGEFVNLNDGLVYHSFNPTVNIKDLPIPEGAHIGAGMDFNVDPMSAAVFWMVGDHIHFFDEIELPNADTEFLCDVLRENSVYGKRLKTIYPDASGKTRKTASPEGRTDFHYIKRAGFEIKAPWDPPKRRDRYNSVNGKLCSKKRETTLTISPKCKKLKKYLSIYNYEKMNTREQEGMSHLLDAFAYPVCYLFPISADVARQMRVVGY